MEKFDFSGWATRANIRCSDGKTILKDAFKECSGKSVPLVWNHQHNDAMNVLGHALLENREDGVYAYCSLNDTEQGRNAKLLVENGDITALSIYANKLRQAGSKVVHGAIREVSLVIAPANPGACIDSIICHGEESEEEAIIYSGEPLELSHSDEEKKKDDGEDMDGDKQTVQDVIDSMTEEQQNVMYGMVGEVMEAAGIEFDEDGNIVEKEKGGDDSMKHNVF